MAHNVYRNGRVHVLAQECPTCVFRPGNLMGLRAGRLRGMVDEAIADNSTIVCHATLGRGVDNACCRGFYDRYADESLALRAARILGVVEEVPVPA